MIIICFVDSTKNNNSIMKNWSDNLQLEFYDYLTQTLN